MIENYSDRMLRPAPQVSLGYVRDGDRLILVDGPHPVLVPGAVAEARRKAEEEA